MTAYREIVLEHFRHPRNRGPLPEANRSAEGANPLCGDRIRIQLLVAEDVIVDARFTADACALCIASASLLTDYVRGRRLTDVSDIDAGWMVASLDGEPPPGRKKCAMLALDTMHRAARSGSA